MDETRRGLIVVSNRLPYALSRDEAGRLTLQPGAGGLVTALVPVLRNRGGTWIGWSGIESDDRQLQAEAARVLAGATRDAGYQLQPVPLSHAEVEQYYHGYSNETIWPLFHDLQSQCRFDPEYGRAYDAVNRRFAETIARHARVGDFIWVHDYQLMLVGHHLRELGVTAPVVYFHHIPFPSIDIFLKLPRRSYVIRALLGYDQLGFQTARDKRNFLQCVRTLVDGARVRSQGSLHLIRWEGREIRVGAFPIGIDFEEFAGQAAQEEVSRRAWNIHAGLPERQIILGVDRLDYTKGIPHRLEAVRTALKRHPELHRRLTFVQVVVPSRVDVPKYARLKEEIERLVGEINGEFTQGGWVPIHYVYRALPREELLAYYRTSEIALITPLQDGMNLVAKEYCACTLEDNSVLILSEFAGSAAQLHRGALLVNPYDVEEVADAIHRAYMMPSEERRARMRRMRRVIRQQHIFWWVDTFMQSAIAKDLSDFPVLEEYDFIPPERVHPEEQSSG
ncbi:MAG: Trehalose-phosphate synthase [candidate division BRC1 bacterium ADurb.BinA292]|nr:MAG: Trehalose-phosphate synthase [candidate division BRC1 bacterium ADurb.BinA292]